jgi:acyl-CoA synthetase (AMP-forming)/AMP-acid ligase II
MNANRHFATLVDALRWRAEQQPRQLGFRFLLDGESREATITYAELHRRACSIAALLTSIQSAGDRTLLVYPPGLELIAALFGCLYAGTLAVIVQPPQHTRSARFLSRVEGICRDASPAAALTTESIRNLLSAPMSGPSAMGAMGAMRWMATDTALHEPVSEGNERSFTTNDIAFLQYTSGSTTEPRGVAVTHGNLVHNLCCIRNSFAPSPGTESVCWLPPYHDMGLIGGVFAPVFLGTAATLLPPASFVQRPMRWLNAISRFRASVSGGPNFAYDLCVRRITPEQREGLDLSCWEVAFSGAEPVSVRTLRDFAATFAPSSFSSAAFKPCYGLAESTLMVSASPGRAAPVVRAFRRSELARNRAVPCADDDPGGSVIASCGRPVASVLIVDPDSITLCRAGTVGEIWVAGPSVATGYWNRPEETRETFHAQLVRTDDERYLRTGDWGFLLDGELFVTGRLKDMIIVDGCNHYPQDIERTVVESHPALVAADCAAFSADAASGEELVVVVAPRGQSPPPAVEVCRAIRAAVSQHHELRVGDIVLVRSGRIPRTSSGKIRRHLCKTGYLSGTLRALESQ